MSTLITALPVESITGKDNDMPKVTIILKLDPEQKQIIETAAKKDDRSMNKWCIVKLLKAAKDAGFIPEGIDKL